MSDVGSFLVLVLVVEGINNGRANTIQLGGRASFAIQKPAATGRARPGTFCTGDVEGTIEVRRTDNPRRGDVACSGERRPSPGRRRPSDTMDGREERGPLSGFPTCRYLLEKYRSSSAPSCRPLVKETVAAAAAAAVVVVVEEEEEEEWVTFSSTTKVREEEEDDDDDGEGGGGGRTTSTTGAGATATLPAGPTTTTVV
jgi:hypothetical protein